MFGKINIYLTKYILYQSLLYLKNENIRSVEEKKNGEGKFRELFGERKCLLGGGK